MIRTLKNLFEQSARKYADKIAYKYKVGKEIEEKSYTDFYNNVTSVATGLKELGLKGKHIAVIGPTSYEYISAYLGIVTSGSVIVPIDKDLSPAEICKLINRADVSAFIYEEGFEEVIKAVKQNCELCKTFIVMNSQDEAVLDEADLTFKQLVAKNAVTDFVDYDEAEVDEEDLAAIIFTSGTTGESKGVMMSNKNLVFNVISGELHFPENTVALSVLPIHHSYCFTCDVLMALYYGTTVCINDSLTRIAKNMGIFKPTITLMVPMMIETMAKNLRIAAKKMPDVPKKLIAQNAFGGKLNTIYSGGAYLNPKLVDEFQEYGIDILQGYGMSEAGPRVSNNVREAWNKQSVGQLIPGTEYKIVNDELWIKNDSVMQGYYKNPEATADTLVDGWLKTGDLAKVDDEGYLYITGRKKNLIILSNGENIAAEQIENKLYEHPEVAEVLVYGEENQIVAEIYPNEEEIAATVDKEEILQNIVKEINVGIPIYKQIHKLKVRDTEFEKTTSRKIKRAKILVGK